MNKKKKNGIQKKPTNAGQRAQEAKAENGGDIGTGGGFQGVGGWGEGGGARGLVDRGRRRPVSWPSKRNGNFGFCGNFSIWLHVLFQFSSSVHLAHIVFC